MSESNCPIISINPDLGSGEAYQRALGSPSIGFKATIGPRVQGDELTQDISSVAADLANAIIAALKQVNNSPAFITIACNTLSLHVFVQPALEILRQDIPNFNEKVKLFLTIQQIEEYSEQKKGKVLVLGTKPLQIQLAKDYGGSITTLASCSVNDANTLDLVQEIIWRVKAVQGSDVTTAPTYEGQPELQNKKALIEKVTTLTAQLNRLGFKYVVMGCTELPTAFLDYGQGLKQNFQLVDPAQLVGEAIKKSLAK